MHHISRHVCSLIAAVGMGAINGPMHATAAMPEVDRPLGVLISPISTEQTVPANPVTIFPPSASDRTQRPLGVLINERSAPTITSPPPSSFRRHRMAQGFTLPSKQQPQFNQPNDASPDRPLGVLLHVEEPSKPAASLSQPRIRVSRPKRPTAFNHPQRIHEATQKDMPRLLGEPSK